MTEPLAQDHWRPIETAPKDGRAVLLLSVPDSAEMDGETVNWPAKAALGHWDPEGTSWVDEYGSLEGDAYTLAVTGVWCVGTGWFQPNEVSHWMPLPEPPNGE